MEMEWFAVDADGAVAAFCTGDEGVYPAEALHCMRPELIAAGVNYDVSGLLASPPWCYEKLAGDWLSGVVLEMTSRDFVIPADPRALYSDPVRLLPHPKYVLRYMYTLRASELKHWIAKGKVRRAWVSHALDFANFNMFFYRCRNDSPEPYIRSGNNPTVPLNVGSLPSPVAELISAVRFADIRFCEKEEICPLRYFDCIGQEEWGEPF